MSDILKKITRIAKIEGEEADKIKMRDTDKVLYTLWKYKKDTDGIETNAYAFWQKLPDKFGDIEINYTETPFEFVNEKRQTVTGTHKNIVGFKWGAKTFEKAQKLPQKIETDKEIRQSVKSDWDERNEKRDEDIKRGLSYNVASRLITPKPDESVFQIADRVKALADAIYTRVMDEQSPEQRAVQVGEYKQTKEAEQWLKSLSNDTPKEVELTPSNEVDVSQIPF